MEPKAKNKKSQSQNGSRMIVKNEEAMVIDDLDMLEEDLLKPKRGIVRHIKVIDEIPAFFSGGTISFTENGQCFGLCNYEIVLYNIEEKKIVRSYKHVNEEITNFTVHKDGLLQATFTRNSMLRILSTEEKRITASTKMTGAFASELEFDKSGKMLVMGDPVGTITVFDSSNLKVLQQFRAHNGLNAMKLSYSKDLGKIHVLTAGRDREVACYDIKSGRTENQFVFEDESFANVCSGDDGKLLIASSLDSNLYIWNLAQNRLLLKTSVSKDIEALTSMTITEKKSKKKHCLIFGGGEDGNLYVWDIVGDSDSKLCEIKEFTLLKDRRKPIHIISVIKSTGVLALTDDDRDITFLNFVDFKDDVGPVFEIVEELMGFNDEILDTKFFNDGPGSKLNNWVAMATNSHTLKLYNFETRKAKFVEGHKGIILCLDVWKDKILTGSKDSTMKLWKAFYDEEEKFQVKLLATFKGHMGNIQSLSIAKKKGNFFVSTSNDKSVKLWELTDQITETTRALTVSQSNKTIVAHEKEVNVVRLSLNDKLVATGSHDRTIKIFNSRNLVQKFELKGHKRGIWDLAFNRYEKLLASSSGDATIKQWDLADGTNTQTFEGHLASVVKINWFSFGTQLVSGSSDGVIKIWNCKRGLCLNTFEKHEGRLWSQDVYEDDEKFQMASGDNNSMFCIWEDCTQEEVDKMAMEKQTKILMTHTMDTLVNQNQFEDALKQAFDMSMVKGFTDILKAFFVYYDYTSERIYIDTELYEETGEKKDVNFDKDRLQQGNTVKEYEEDIVKKRRDGERILQAVIRYCMEKDLLRLLKFVRDMNTSSGKSEQSQRLLRYIIKEIGINRITEWNDKIAQNSDGGDFGDDGKNKEESLFEKFQDIIESYTDRHYERLRGFYKKSCYLDFVLAQSGLLYGEGEAKDLEMNEE